MSYRIYLGEIINYVQIISESSHTININNDYVIYIQNENRTLELPITPSDGFRLIFKNNSSYIATLVTISPDIIYPTLSGIIIYPNERINLIFWSGYYYIL